MQCPTEKIKHKKISIRTQAGLFVLEFSGKGLCAVRFPAGNGSLPGKRCLSPLLRKVRYAKLDMTGFTPFQLKVYAALRKIPAGKTVTYAELAKRAGYPGAARAVGSAMRKNRLPIVIPCHRVIKGDGSLGLYSQGIVWKRKLLRNEQYARARRKGQSKKLCALRVEPCAQRVL